MNDDVQYAVYLHPGALESLGEAVAPYMSQGPHGPHFLCTDFDAGGTLCEMTLDVTGSDGRSTPCEVMIPVAMIRLVVSVGGVGDAFGFHPPAPAQNAASKATSPSTPT